MMMLKKTAIAAGIVLLSAGAASANPAVAAQNVHLRVGPGPEYAAVTVVPRGAGVRAWNCDGLWCQVTYRGRSGFADQSSFDITRERPTVAVAPPVAPVVVERAVAPVVVPPGYDDYAYAPEYQSTYVEPAPLPNPFDFPLLPWNW
jgi:uncharacterized protein YraI